MTILFGSFVVLLQQVVKVFLFILFTHNLHAFTPARLMLSGIMIMK